MHFLAKTLVTLLVLLAALLSVARWIGPGWLEANQQEFLDTLSAQSGYQVSAESLSSHWYRGGPVIELDKLLLRDKSDTTTIFRAARVELRLSIFDLLRYQNIVPTAVIVDGLRLTMVRDSEGAIHVYGIEQVTDEEDTPAADISGLLFQPEALSLKNAEITFVDLYNTNRVTIFDPAEVTLVNRGDKHALRGRLGIDNRSHGELSVAAEFETQGAHMDRWDGNIYLLTSELDLAWLIGENIPGHYGINAGNSSFELWSQWRGGHLSQLHGRLSANNISITSPSHESPDLDIDWASGQFRWKKETKGWRLDLANAHISNGDSLWPTKSLAIALRREDEEAPPVLFIGADKFEIAQLLATLKFRPINSVAVNNFIAAKPEGTITDMQLAIRMQRPVQWHFHAKLENILSVVHEKLPAIRNLRGYIDADRDGGRLSLDMDNSLFNYPGLFRQPLDISRLKGDIVWQRKHNEWWLASNKLEIANDHLQTTSAFRLTTRQGNKPLLELQTHFHNGDVAFAPLYYPTGIMKSNLVKWLDRSLKSGRVTQGILKLNGPLDHFPFHKTHDGMFDVQFDVEDVLLDYWEEWPPISQLSAHARFYGDSMTIEGSTGFIYNSKVEHVIASIEHFKPLSPLIIKGSVAGALDDAFKLLRESPLSRSFGRFASKAKVTGDSLLAVDIQLPLMNTHPQTRFEGSVSLNDNQLGFTGTSLTIKDIKGVLHITSIGLEGDEMHASVFGIPLKVRVSPDKKGGAVISADHRFATDELKQALPQLKQLPLHGESDWKLSVDIPPLSSQKSPLFTAASSLQGTSVNLPLSLQKSAREIRPTAVIIPLNKEFSSVDIRYGKADIRINPATLSGDMTTPEMRGSFTLPANQQTPLTADFDYLKLNFDTNKIGSSNKNPGNPRDIPPLILKSEKLIINDVHFGSMHLVTKHIPNGAGISKLTVGDDNTRLNATGSWTYSKGVHQTIIDASIKSSKLGDALKGLGLTEQMEASPGTFTAKLRWRAAPQQFAFEKLDGEVSVQTGEGRFNDAQPGFGRLIGLANLRALQRRLSLDFSDFTKEGFAYDEILGTATIAKGIANTENFKIKAPAGVIEIRGLTNLNTRQLEQDVKVLPEIHGALPLAGAIAGGPAVGAALLLAGAVAGDKIDRMAQINYTVRGDWDNPIIERIGVIGSDPDAPTVQEGALDSHTGLPIID